MVVSLKDNVYDITESGKDAVAMYNKGVSAPEEVANTPIPTHKYIDVTQLIKEIKTIVKKHTGSVQAEGYGKSLFVPAVKDLEEHLLSFKRKYKKLWDADKVKEAILNHTEKCAKKGVFIPIIKYFVYNGEKGSPLAAILEIGDVKDASDNFDIVETKNLFE